MFKTSLILVSLFSGSLASVNAHAANLIEQKCENAGSYSIRVVNENGRCSAFWTCDGASYKAFCEGSECRCYQEGNVYFNKVNYQDCDSSRLKLCFTK